MLMKRLTALSVIPLISVLVPVSGHGRELVVPPIAANENRVSAGTLDNGVLTLHLEIREGRWHPGPVNGPAISPQIPVAIDTAAFGEAGRGLQMPGPLIRVPSGTDVHVSVHNRLTKTVYIHGLNTHPEAGTHVLELGPDETKDAAFSAGDPGTYLYWASTEPAPSPLARATADIPLSGAFVVDAPGTGNSDRVFVLGEWATNEMTQRLRRVLTINGKTWPYTERLQATQGQPERWRVVNATNGPHPMHLHGFYYYVEGVGDGEHEQYYAPTEVRMVNTEVVPSGHTFDLTWRPDRVGNWLFHCHFLEHMTVHLMPEDFGPAGPPSTTTARNASHAEDGMTMGMTGLVLGVTVNPQASAPSNETNASATVGAHRHLYVRDRHVSPYSAAGLGFYLAGVSKRVGAIGPPLVVTAGIRTAITVTNDSNEPTAVHWHGMEDDSYYDGIPGWDGTPQHRAPLIKPGQSFVAYLTPRRAGTFIYHTHWDDVRQLTGGLYGALLVLPPNTSYDPATDKVFILGRSGPSDSHDPLVLNGIPQPGVMILVSGRTYRFRLVNITPNDGAQVSLTALSATASRLARWRAVAKDGADLPPQQATVSDAKTAVFVGETRDYEFAPASPGKFVLRFLNAQNGSEISQVIFVVSPTDRMSAFAGK
jgi:FtsP/CotA-like multicopper oxidase with cupredoxin domain